VLRQQATRSRFASFLNPGNQFPMARQWLSWFEHTGGDKLLHDHGAKGEVRDVLSVDRWTTIDETRKDDPRESATASSAYRGSWWCIQECRARFEPILLNTTAPGVFRASMARSSSHGTYSVLEVTGPAD